MADYKLSKEWIKKNGEKIKEAYSSAGARGYDVSSKTDVLKLLEDIDPQNANEENAEIFSSILVLFASSTKRTIAKKHTALYKKEKLIN